MVVVVVSYLLAASVVQVLGRSRAAVFWLLRSVGLVAYVVLAAAGHASITAIMWCESLTMASVIGLWIWAWLHQHPMGRPMLVAIGVSIAAAMLRLVPGAAALAGLDPDSAYHLGQIAGMVLLCHAVASTSGRSDTWSPTRSARRRWLEKPQPEPPWRKAMPKPAGSGPRQSRARWRP
jgi:hypothetical protein